MTEAPYDGHGTTEVNWHFVGAYSIDQIQMRETNGNYVEMGTFIVLQKWHEGQS